MICVNFSTAGLSSCCFLLRDGAAAPTRSLPWATDHSKASPWSSACPACPSQLIHAWFVSPDALSLPSPTSGPANSCSLSSNAGWAAAPSPAKPLSGAEPCTGCHSPSPCAALVRLCLSSHPRHQRQLLSRESRSTRLETPPTVASPIHFDGTGISRFSRWEPRDGLWPARVPTCPCCSRTQPPTRWSNTHSRSPTLRRRLPSTRQRCATSDYSPTGTPQLYEMREPQPREGWKPARGHTASR